MEDPRVGLFNNLSAIYKTYCQGGWDYMDSTNIGKDDVFEPGQLIEMYSVAYGATHVAMFERIFLPVLFRNKDFEKLLQERKVIFNLYTTSQDLPLWNNAINTLEQKGIGFRLNCDLLGSSICPEYFCGSFAQNALPLLDQIHRSIKYKSIIVCALPDLLMLGGSLKQVIDSMKPKDYVVCRGPRIALETSVSSMDWFYNSDIKQVIDLCMTDFIHPQTMVGLLHPNHLLSIKQSSEGYEVQSACPQPLAFYGQQKHVDRMLTNPSNGKHILGSFFCIDNDFIDMAYEAKELKHITDSDKFFWAELTSLSAHKASNFTAAWQQINGGYYPPGFKYSRKIKQLWRST